MPSSPTPNSETYGTRSTRSESGASVVSPQTERSSNIKDLDKVTAFGKRGEGIQRGFRIMESDSDRYVKFKVTPEISESGTANYVEESDFRAASSILVWMGSPSRTFSVNAKLVSRTKEEAAENRIILNLLRSWRMPKPGVTPLDAGSGTALETTTNSPQILQLRGWGLFYDIQVVMRSINIEVNSDSDKIPVGDDAEWEMPIILPISMSLQEIHSYTDTRDFDLAAYKEGSLPTW